MKLTPHNRQTRPARSHYKRQCRKRLIIAVALSVATICIHQAQAGTFTAQDGNFVTFDDGPLDIRFHRNYGGTPIGVDLNDQPFSWEHAGAGFQSVFETRGNDPTAAGHNGIDAFPIARIGHHDADRVYYARETKLTSQEYQVTGFMPFFLDYMGSDSVEATDTKEQWSGSDAEFGIPLFFQNGAKGMTGISMVGNHDRFGNGQPKLGEIANGRVAFSTSISLREASPGSFAGVVYRRQLANTQNAPTVQDVYNAPGYGVYVNTAGTMQIWASDRATPLFDSNAEVWWLNHWIRAQATHPGGKGVHVEIRTHNLLPGYQELWLKDTVVPGSRPFLWRTFTHNSPINTGAHLGFFAYSTGGRIGFYNRQVFDVGVEAINTYRAAPGGGLDYEFELKPAPGLEGSTFKAYSVTQQFFALRSAVEGVHSNLNGWQSTSTPLFDSFGQPNNLFIGKRKPSGQRGEGLLCRPISATINHQPAQAPYASLQLNTANPMESVIHCNALPENVWLHGPAPDVNNVRLVTNWSYHPGD